MPLYEYLCEKCGERFEAMQKFSDEPLQTCTREECGGKVVKQISATSFALKGTGWYTTDYKKKSGDLAKKADKKD